MSNADTKYNEIIKEIIDNGIWDKDQKVRTKWADGTPAYTKSIINVQMKFDNGKELPILTSKRVPQKDPLSELIWIWQYKSNDVRLLRDQLKCNVWNEWEREHGDIGRAYGWQLGNKYRKVDCTDVLLDMIKTKQINNYIQISTDCYLLDQVDYLLYMLKFNPFSRRIKTTLWCVEDLDDMALEPCVYETHWQLWNNKLNLTVNIRSNDMALGSPYNIYQYSILHRLIAQVSGHPVGEICFNIDNSHVYERHMESLREQIQREVFDAPDVWINPDIKSFYDFKLDDIKLIDYKHGSSIRLEVAV